MSTIKSFEEFWPFYLSQHRNPTCRWLHFVGTSIAVAVLVAAFAHGTPRYAWFAPVIGYGFAWVGHFGFEKNRPATFRYPLWSLAADFKMYGTLLRNRRD